MWFLGHVTPFLPISNAKVNTKNTCVDLSPRKTPILTAFDHFRGAAVPIALPRVRQRNSLANRVNKRRQAESVIPQLASDSERAKKCAKRSLEFKGIFLCQSAKPSDVAKIGLRRFRNACLARCRRVLTVPEFKPRISAVWSVSNSSMSIMSNTVL